MQLLRRGIKLAAVSGVSYNALNIAPGCEDGPHFNSTVYSRVFEKVSPAVVKVESVAHVSKRQGRRLGLFALASGSGMLFRLSSFGDEHQELADHKKYDANVYVVTSGHVVELVRRFGKADQGESARDSESSESRGWLSKLFPFGFDATLQIVLADSRVFDAELHSYDLESDLAVLRVRNSESLALSSLPSVKFGYSDSNKIKRGQIVTIMGAPYLLRNSLSHGIISNLGVPLPLPPPRAPGIGYIQTDAPVFEGNSGGPLCDLDGSVLGVVALKMMGAQEASGIGFCIPINTAKKVVSQLVRHREVRRSQIGITMETISEGLKQEKSDKELREIKHGVYIDSVVPDTPASRAGLLEGDVIVAVDGKRVIDEQQVFDAMCYEPARHAVHIFRPPQAKDSTDRECAVGTHMMVTVATVPRPLSLET